MWDNMTVGGFHFNSAAEYADAKHEEETIRTIESRMDVNNPEIALKVYFKLLERQTLHTIVGLTFLKKLYDCALKSGIIEESELKAINAPTLTEVDLPTQTGDETALENDTNATEFSSDVENSIPQESEGEEKPGDEIRRLNRIINSSRENEKKSKTIADYYRKKVKKLTIIIVALVVIVISLFIIAVRNKNLTFTTEEIAVQDKYAAWEEELTERENALKARENALD